MRGNHNQRVYDLVCTLQEFLDKRVVSGCAVVFEIFKVFHDVTLLLPEIDQFLEFHLTLHVKDILDSKIFNKSVSLKFLSDLSLYLVCWNVQIITVDKLSGVSQISSVQIQHTTSEVGTSD